MENVKDIRDELGELLHEIAEVECRLDGLEMKKRELYVRYFYAVNGMEVGQPFKFRGDIYYRVEGYDNCVKAYPKTKKGFLSTKGKWIYCSKYKEIEPLPMGNDKKEK